jgi:outer membrane immunogenic protein
LTTSESSSQGELKKPSGATQPECSSKRRSEMFKKAFYYLAATIVLIGAASGQEIRSEISVQGTGFFTKNSDGNGIQNRATETGGVLVGYRYNINRWLAAEANYGYARNTQGFFGSLPARIQANVHEVTGSAVVKLPGFKRVLPFVRAGGGALVFDPTGNTGGTFAGATSEAKGAFLYGGGADYVFTNRLLFRVEYRGLVYKAPSFNLASLNTDKFTHAAQPSAGIVFRF